MLPILNAVLSGLFAGLASSLVSVGIEKLGGALGGLIGSSPSTLLPAVIGLWLSITSTETNLKQIVQFQKAMLVIPTSMLINGGFLFCWRILPAFFISRYPSLEAKKLKLLGIVAGAAYSFWLVLSTALVFIYRSITSDLSVSDEGLEPSVAYITSHSSQSPAFFLSIGSLIFHLSTGLWANYKTHPTPKSKSKVTLGNNLVRGIAAGLAIFAAVMLGSVNSLLGGVITTFPAIFGTACISIWILSGYSVSSGAIEPLFLGSLSTSVYAFLSAFLLPYLDRAMSNTVASIVVSILVIYIFCLVFVSYPLHLYIQARIRVNRKGKEKIVAIEPTMAVIVLVDPNES